MSGEIIINLIERESTCYVSSRQIAEHFKKQHKDVLEKISDTIVKLGGAENSATYFIENSYIHEQNGQEYKEYLLSKDGFALIVMGFTGEIALHFKTQYIKAFNEMEKKLMNPLEMLMGQTKEKLVLLSLELTNKIKQQEIALLEQKPLVDFANTVSNSKDTIDIGKLAKLVSDKNGIEIGRNRLFEFLRNQKILMGNNEPYQKYITYGWFILEEVPFKIGGDVKLTHQTRVTSKGQISLINIIQKFYKSK